MKVYNVCIEAEDGVIDAAGARGRGDDRAQVSAVAVLRPLQRSHAAQNAARRGQEPATGKVNKTGHSVWTCSCFKFKIAFIQHNKSKSSSFLFLVAGKSKWSSFLFLIAGKN